MHNQPVGSNDCPREGALLAAVEREGGVTYIKKTY